MKTQSNPNQILRRRLLLGAGSAAAIDLERITAAAASAISTNSWAQATPAGEDYRCLVCLFMYGGNDSNNMVIPMDDAQHAIYAAKRGPLVIPKNNILAIPTSNTGSLKLGLHPAMTALQKVFTNGKASVVANVGPLATPTQKRSGMRVQSRCRRTSFRIATNRFSGKPQQLMDRALVGGGA